MSNTESKIKACIFDLDGTLIDSMGIWRAIDVEFFDIYGKKMPEDYQSRIEGMSIIEVADFTIKEYGFEITSDVLLKMWNDMAFDFYSNRIGFKKGAKEYLEKCKEKGIKTAVVTSNSKVLYDAIASNLGLEEFINITITGEDVKNGKPHPEGYLTAAERLGVKAEECIVFEDLVTGIQSGIAAGMTTCAMYDDYSANQDELKKQTAMYYFEDFCKVDLLD